MNFKITEDNLKFYNYYLEYVAEPGEFEVFIGTNSRDAKRAQFSFQDSE